MLPKPPHIADANIADMTTRYPWDEWNVEAAYQPADPDLQERMSQLSHRANVAVCTAMAEWVVWRFETLSSDILPHQYLEAAWASMVHKAYARYMEFEDDDWRGVIRGPLRMSMEILIDLIWGLQDTTPGENVAWMSNLVELVLTNPQPFQEWREQCIQRLEQYYPPRMENEDVIFSDEISLGSWVPRELFDLTQPFEPSQTRSYIERFVQTLDYTTNPFLNKPDEMIEFPDYYSTPYQITDVDE
jgi:hypothetical protein